VANRIQIRGDTAANWASVNPVLADREFGVVTDAVPPYLKMGNGTAAWNSLPISGMHGITVSASAPSSPTLNQLWLDIS
jgi:Major tropism determinant N-terminal domain